MNEPVDPFKDLNSLEPSNVIRRWRFCSTMVQVMACSLTAPSHYLNQCYLYISKALWHSSEDIIIRRFEDTNQLSKVENYIFEITLRSSWGQWVNSSPSTNLPTPSPSQIPIQPPPVNIQQQWTNTVNISYGVYLILNVMIDWFLWLSDSGHKSWNL